MNKSDLVNFVAENAELSKKSAEEALAAMLKGIMSGLSQDGHVSLVGFGSFQVKERAARQGRNPQTGEPIAIAASKSIKFSAGKAVKDAVQ